MTQVALIRDCPLDENIRKNPFVVSLSNHELPFDKLRANGFLANGQSRLITDDKVQDGAYLTELLSGKSYVVHGVKRSALYKQHCFVVVKVVNNHLW